jgi:hypothetical protein
MESLACAFSLLVKETYAVFSAVHPRLPLSGVRHAILHAQVLQKTSYETRRKIWNALYHRLSILSAEGLEGRALIEAPDWRLFLWSEKLLKNPPSTL